MFECFKEPELKAALAEKGYSMKLSADDVAVQPGKYIRLIPLVKRGLLKVLRVNEDGEEHFLYYIGAGESCAVSLSSCLRNRKSDIKAVVIEDTELLAVPATEAALWFERYASWRLFVLETIDRRYNELLHALDKVAFRRMDERLGAYLSGKAKAMGSQVIAITHREIADELSTSREVVSRLLKTLEIQGKVKLQRNRIELLMPV